MNKEFTRRNFVRFLVAMFGAAVASACERILPAQTPRPSPTATPIPTPTFTTELRYLVLQEGNSLPKTRITPRKSWQLLDNHIGGDYGSDHPGSQDAIFQLGLKWVRLAFNGSGSSLNWQRVETSRGTYSISLERDGFITDLADNGINIVLNLGVGPGESGEVRTRFGADGEKERYLDYVRFMVGNFKGRVKYYELWNEPDAQTPWGNIPVNIYANLVERTVPIIREEDPNAKVVVGATGGHWVSDFPGYGGFSRYTLHTEYLRSLLESGVAPLVDVISWHPFYGHRPDDPYYQDYPRTVEEIRQVAVSQGFSGGYLAEEIKWRSEAMPGDGMMPMVTEKVAAKYYARAIVMHLGLNVIASTAGQLGRNEPQPDTIRALCTVMSGVEPISLPVEIQSEAHNIIHYSFSLPDGDRLFASWTNGIALDDDPGVEATLLFPGLSSQRVVGIDVLNGLEQEIITEVENGDLVIRNLMVKDYPIILRIYD